VAALAGGVEEIVELGRAEGLKKLGAAERVGEVESGKMRPASAEGFAQEGCSVEAKDVENHGDDGDFAPEKQVGFLSAESFLEFEKRKRPAFGKREDFSIEHGFASDA
jgi:hypothetical protein